MSAPLFGILRRVGRLLRRGTAARTSPPRPRPPQVEGLEQREVPAVIMSVPVTVSGEANIFGAGLSVPPDPGGGGGGVLPTMVNLTALTYHPNKLDFPLVSGSVSGWAAAGGYNGADGGPYWGGVTNVPAWNGISGIRDNRATMFLVGVFLGPNGQPATAPPSLDVSNANTVASIQPLLGQQFFIGDGRTASQALQTVTVPAGAARLYLGFAEGWGFGLGRRPGFYSDNGGSLKVEVADASSPLSFELNSLAPPAPTRQDRVARWIAANRATINAVARAYNVDARAIAGAIAWEALENTMSWSWRGAGPGKVHVSDNYADILPPLRWGRGSGVARQAEDRYASDPNPARRLRQLSVAERIALLSGNPAAAIHYVGAIMGAYAAEADTVGYAIHGSPEILATLYNGATVDGQSPNADLLNFTAKLRNKHGAPMSYVGNAMGTWVHDHLSYLESALNG